MGSKEKPLNGVYRFSSYVVSDPQRVNRSLCGTCDLNAENTDADEYPVCWGPSLRGRVEVVYGGGTEYYDLMACKELIVQIDDFDYPLIGDGKNELKINLVRDDHKEGDESPCPSCPHNNDGQYFNCSGFSRDIIPGEQNNETAQLRLAYWGHDKRDEQLLYEREQMVCRDQTHIPSISYPSTPVGHRIFINSAKNDKTGIVPKLNNKDET